MNSIEKAKDQSWMFLLWYLEEVVTSSNYHCLLSTHKL